jgi:hypothetical protein
MDIDQLAALRTQVLGAGFILSMLSGAIVRCMHFCTIGALWAP